MKIEIGESLALSYLKHVKKCTFYQTNWKSSSQWKRFNEGIVVDIFSKIKNIKEYIDKNIKEDIDESVEEDIVEFYNIFRSDIDQTLKQAEIDVLGIDQNGKIYAMDIAYHEGGRNYKGKKKTIENLIKKLLRSYLILLSYFPDRDYEITFASPKVNDATKRLISDAFNELRKFLEKNVEFRNEVKFIYISDNTFSKEILYETIDKSKKDSDTNELFMRSYKLLELFNKAYNIAENTTNLNKKNSPTDYIEFVFKPSDEKSLEFEFIPSDEKQFKKELIKTKQAKITWFYPDRQEETIWNADKISENSKIRENIRNRKKVKAREKSGLYKVKLEII